MILVLPFCAKDGALAIANLEWIAELDPTLPYHCLLSHDDSTPPAMIERMSALANRIFQKVSVMWYPTPEKKYWPAAANWAFQNAARYVAHFFPQDSWLFLEADATPIRKGWLQALDAEHVKGGKAISGHVVDGMGHPNGVAIYPPMVAAYSQQAMTVEETAWDVVIGATVDKEYIHNIGIGEYNGQPSRHLMQHCWNMHEQTGEPTNGHGYSPTFKSVDEVVRKIDLNACIYHRCKDGSLIRYLREFYQAPHKAMVPNHTSNETTNTITGNEAGNRHSNLGESKPGREHKVPDATMPGSGDRLSGEDGNAETVQAVAEASTFIGKCEILIVTYGKDEPWLRWAMRAIRRHCTGFTGVTLAIPDRDAAAFRDAASEHAKSDCGLKLNIKMFHEKPSKGMLTHMAVMGSADQFVPKDTEFVLHLDADCIFKEPTTPGDYIRNGKPEYIWRTYSSLAEVRDGQKVVSDCAQWKKPTEDQLGFEVDQYTMARHPSVFPIGFYKLYREHIEKLHGKPYLDFMISGRNTFPQDKMDFTAMGAWAFKFMHDRFEWIDVSGGNHLAPRDRQKTFWSHAGVLPEVQKEIESFIA